MEWRKILVLLSMTPMIFGAFILLFLGKGELIISDGYALLLGFGTIILGWAMAVLGDLR